MKKTNEVLEALVSHEGVNLSDYYSITMRRNDMSLQGDFSSYVMKKMREHFNVEFRLEEDMLMAQFNFEGVLINITLT